MLLPSDIRAQISFKEQSCVHTGVLQLFNVLLLAFIVTVKGTDRDTVMDKESLCQV